MSFDGDDDVGDDDDDVDDDDAPLPFWPEWRLRPLSATVSHSP